VPDRGGSGRRHPPLIRLVVSSPHQRLLRATMDFAVSPSPASDKDAQWHERLGREPFAGLAVLAGTALTAETAMPRGMRPLSGCAKYGWPRVAAPTTITASPSPPARYPPPINRFKPQRTPIAQRRAWQSTPRADRTPLCEHCALGGFILSETRWANDARFLSTRGTANVLTTKALLGLTPTAIECRRFRG
jgi:hypothetical protein